jgi:hypothetical protein
MFFGLEMAGRPSRLFFGFLQDGLSAEKPIPRVPGFDGDNSSRAGFTCCTSQP